MSNIRTNVFLIALAIVLIVFALDEVETKSLNRDPKFLKHFFKLPMNSIKLRVVTPPEPPKVHSDCLLENGTMLYHGQSIKVYCDTWYCQDGKVIKPDLPVYKTECPDDFVIKPDLGCVKKVYEKTTWCDARRRCWAMGADLLSLDGNAELDEHDPLHDFLDGSNKDWWVGLYRTNSDLWSWTIGCGQIQEESRIWKTGEPNREIQFMCARAKQGSYKLADKPCDDSSHTYRFVCEVPGFGKK